MHVCFECQRPDFGGRFHRITDADFPRALDKLIDERFRDTSLQQYSGARDTQLPIVTVNIDQRPVDGAFQVRIFEHDIRGLTTQLQVDRCQVGRSRIHDGFGRGRATGKCDPVDVRMRNERVSGYIATTNHQVENTCRHSRLFQQFDHACHCQRSVLRWLDDTGIAKSDTRGYLHAGQGQGGIPRGYQRRHARRFACHQG